MKFTATLALTLAFFVLAEAQYTYNKCGYKVAILTATARNAYGLRRAVTRFQDALGGIDNVNEPGPLFSGFRQINWDAEAVPFDMPFNFFDVNVTRGAVFQAAKREFRVSNPVPPPVDNLFDSLLPKRITRQFQTFSPERLFTPFVKNRVTQTFKIPATNKRASVSGMGAVFVDVDLRKQTWMDFFTKSGCLIARVFVPPRNKGLSFAGLYDVRGKPIVYKVVMKLGTISVLDAGSYYRGRGDVVVQDDFIYGEPALY